MPKNTCDLAGKDEREYLDILADTIVDMYGCTEKDARRIIKISGIEKMIENETDFPGGIPLSAWAETAWSRKR